MKNIIKILVVLNFMSCRSQTIYNLDVTPENRISSNYYIKDIDNHHDDIVGVWKWENGNDSFEITLQEFEMYTDQVMQISNSYRDEIYGKYKYIHNNFVVAEVITIETFTDFKLSLIYRSPVEYAVVIHDIVSSKGKVGKFTITSPTTAILELWDSEGIKVNTETGIDFALPTYVELIKQ